MGDEWMLDAVKAYFSPKTPDDGVTVAEATTDELSHVWFDEVPKDRGQDSHLEWWRSSGKPHCWAPVESIEVDGVTCVALVDFSYGWLGLLEGRTVVDVSKCVVTGEKCVLLDKDYYGVDKYLWR